MMMMMLRIMKQKLESLELLKQALHIPFKNPHFIIFLFFTSLPLLVFTIIYEMIYQHTILEAADISLRSNYSSMDFLDILFKEKSSGFLVLFLFYLGILHFQDLINTICVVDAASVIHTGQKTMNLKEIVAKIRNETRFRGPLITSIYSLFLVSVVFSGLTFLAGCTFLASNNLLFAVFFGGVFVFLLVKYIEWSAVWNMAAVISVLEEKEGDVAFVISSHLSRGSRQQGIVYSLVFLSWNLASRLAFLYLGWHGGEGNGIMAATFHSSVLCLGNTIKWLVFTVYYYDCKRRSEEKKRLNDGKMIADEEPVAV